MIYRVNNLFLDDISYDVYRGNREIKLSTTEFSLLKFLMANKGKAVTRQEILENIKKEVKLKGEIKADSNYIDVFVSYLRRKIDKNEEIRLIKTIRDVGYKIQDNKNPFEKMIKKEEDNG